MSGRIASGLRSSWVSLIFGPLGRCQVQKSRNKQVHMIFEHGFGIHHAPCSALHRLARNVGRKQRGSEGSFFGTGKSGFVVGLNCWPTNCQYDYLKIRTRSCVIFGLGVYHVLKPLCSFPLEFRSLCGCRSNIIYVDTLLLIPCFTRHCADGFCSIVIAHSRSFKRGVTATCLVRHASFFYSVDSLF